MLGDRFGAIEVYVSRVQGLALETHSDRLRLAFSIRGADGADEQVTPWTTELSELAGTSFYFPYRAPALPASEPDAEAAGEEGSGSGGRSSAEDESADEEDDDEYRAVGGRPRSDMAFTLAVQSQSMQAAEEPRGPRPPDPLCPASPGLSRRRSEVEALSLARRRSRAEEAHRAQARTARVTLLYEGGHAFDAARVVQDTSPLQLSVSGQGMAARRLSLSPKRRSLTSVAPEVAFLTTVSYHRSILHTTEHIPLPAAYRLYCKEWGLRPNKVALEALGKSSPGLPPPSAVASAAASPLAAAAAADADADDDAADDDVFCGGGGSGGGGGDASPRTGEGGYSEQTRVLEALDLSGTYLGDRGMLAFLATLRHFSTLRSLNLQSNGLGVAAVTALREALQPHKHLHFLGLKDNSKMFEASGDLLRQLLSSHSTIVAATWDEGNMSACTSNKIRLQLAANTLASQRRLGITYSLPLPELHKEVLRGLWSELVEPPYVSPVEAMVSPKLEMFMRCIDAAFEDYQNPGLRAVFRPRVDTLPTKHKIVATNDMTLSTSFYSALFIGMAAVLAEKPVEAFEQVTNDALSRLGSLYTAFGVRPYHMTELIQHSVPALERCGITVTPTGKVAWQSALAIIGTALLPSAYPL